MVSSSMSAIVDSETYAVSDKCPASSFLIGCKKMTILQSKQAAISLAKTQMVIHGYKIDLYKIVIVNVL